MIHFVPLKCLKQKCNKMNKELERNKINKEDKTVWDVFGIH